ncbi:hypothetical protein H0I72_01030 [Flavobacterium psychrophilum]|uniref:hypothetical protein n=1 Tax=Flavobacterium psychrophilum TaxID=96345 RepID=UPI001888BD76|nr:hypothetical protein [Flavobacterium psychrophilum]MBF2023008.1 hypothetical protein [Flavobacterium psychrophilum]
MGKKLYAILLATISITTYACPMCEKQQPKVLRGITHGAGPESNLDYIIVWTMVITVLITLFFALKYLIKPKENQTNHIKRTIINFE